MAESTEADRYLIEKIHQGDPDGWSQLVQRYQGRLLAFARSRIGRRSEAEDLVQDTFVSFLTNLRNFNPELSLETYLFTILRRRVIDQYRGRARRTCFLHETLDGSGDSSYHASEMIGGEEPSASVHALRAEHDEQMRRLLAAGLNGLLGRLRDAENFRDLKILELLFYAQVRNKDAARIMAMDEKQIALIKHRALKEIREHVLAAGGEEVPVEQWASDAPASLLTDVWEQRRLTCPKRSTIGRYLLGTLEGAWKQYVEFHVAQLGCHFCQANVEDLRRQSETAPTQLHDRVLQSTIGFFRPESRA